MHRRGDLPRHRPGATSGGRRAEGASEGASVGASPGEEGSAGTPAVGSLQGAAEGAFHLDSLGAHQGYLEACQGFQEQCWHRKPRAWARMLAHRQRQSVAGCPFSSSSSTIGLGSPVLACS
jgi:hypothetical protein